MSGFKSLVPLSERKELEGQISLPFLTVILAWGNCRINIKAFFDSGAVDCLVDISWARDNFLTIHSLANSHPILMLDGRPLGSGLVSEVTKFLSMFINLDGHSERIRVFLVDSPTFPIVLGHAWLVKHKPQVSWGNRFKPIIQWGPNCYDHCSQVLSDGSSRQARGDINHSSEDVGEDSELPQSVVSECVDNLDWDSQFDWERPVSEAGPVDCPIDMNIGGQNKRTRLSVALDDFLRESDEDFDSTSNCESLGWDIASSAMSEGGNYAGDWKMGAALSFALPPNVPPDYSDLAEVFSKQKAITPPPHRAYDCAIDLQPGTTAPRGALYSLSIPESKVMKEYIQEALANGFIRPSTSAAGAGVFFISKKDGSLRPCINYRGLNNITIKNRYPLPLMSSAFERLQGAVFLTNLDLRNTYNLIRIQEGDEWKMAFNTHDGHYEYRVMPFGLANAPSVCQIVC